MKLAHLGLCLISVLAAPAFASANIKAPLINREGQEIGTATFSTTSKGVKVAINAVSLPPGLHGIHVHNTGRCDKSGKFESAGSHFAPNHKGHGLLGENGPHAGDLPNLEVKADGTAKWEATLKEASIEKNKLGSLVGPDGTAIIIHAAPDDQASDPSGNSGDRIACAVIAGAAKN